MNIFTKKVTGNKGFTLIELLVVVAIIGILAATILASLGGARQRARISRAQSEISSMRAQAELWYLANGNTYATAMFADNGVNGLGKLVTSIKKVDTAAAGTASTNAWQFTANFGTSQAPVYFCADSTGFAGDITAGPDTTNNKCQ